MHQCHSVAVVEYLIGTFQALAETLDATLVTGDRRLRLRSSYPHYGGGRSSRRHIADSASGFQACFRRTCEVAVLRVMFGRNLHPSLHRPTCHRLKQMRALKT